jgi:hypothetical protein
MLLISILAVGIARAQMDFENAVAIWLFDDGAGDEVEDISGNDNMGTIMGDYQWVAGKFGGAWSLMEYRPLLIVALGKALISWVSRISPYPYGPYPIPIT